MSSAGGNPWVARPCKPRPLLWYLRNAWPSARTLGYTSFEVADSPLVNRTVLWLAPSLPCVCCEEAQAVSRDRHEGDMVK